MKCLKIIAMLAVMAWWTIAQGVDGPVFREIPIPVNQLVYNAATQKLYATVPANADPGNANRVLEIDPESGLTTRSVFLGNSPNAIAMSPDGSFAYVGLDGPAAVRRLQIASMTGGIQFGMGQADFSTTLYAEDIIILPDRPDSIAVSRRTFCCSPHSYGTAIYDSGVLRSNTTEGGGTGWMGCPSIAMLNPSTILGLSNETTNYQLQVQHIDASGIGVVDVVSNVIPGFYERLTINGGWALATSGRVVDPVTLALVGTFAAQGPVVPEALPGVVAFADRNHSSIRLFDRNTFVPLETFGFPPALGTPSVASSCGLACVAFATNAGMLIIAQLGRDPIFGDGFDE